MSPSAKGENIMVINCTPHDVLIYGVTSCMLQDGRPYIREEGEEYPEPLRVYPAAKSPARAIYVQRVAGAVDGTLIYRWFTEDIVNLPDPKPGTYYIVSKRLAQACPERKDLIFPHTVVRDADGHIVGYVDFYRV